MNRLLNLISLGLLTLLGFFLVAFGALYISVSDMLPFHAAAIPPDTREAVEPLYHALMALTGGAAAALGLLGLYVTWTAARLGTRGAATAVVICYILAIGVAGWVAERLAEEAGAPTSADIMIGLIAIGLAALGLRAVASRARVPGAV